MKNTFTNLLFIKRPPYTRRNIKALIMRISQVYLLIMTSTMIAVASPKGNGQSIETTTVELEIINEPLKNVFQKIEAQTDFLFHWNGKVNNYTNVMLPKGSYTVKDALDIVLRGTELKYEQNSHYILISLVTDKEEVSKKIPEKKLNEPNKDLVALITGIVKDATTQEPLAGVNIIVKGTTRGSTTDVVGKFSIEADDSDVLVFSYVGYKTIERPVNDRSVIDITLEEDVAALETVVINAGYYTITDRTKTGNIVKVTSKEIENQPVTSPLMALQGRAAGVEITPVNGIPGSAPTIRIRGQNSLRNTITDNGNLPLYVINGVPVDSKTVQSYNIAGFDPLSTIDPNTIQSIEILKDADATAIYGSRGANGVILITTKQGIGTEETNVEINAYTGVGKIVHRMDMLNTEQYLEIRKEAFKNAGKTPGFFDYDVNGTWDSTRYTDWQDVLLGGTAEIHDVQVGVSGGSATTSFRLGGGYHKENTIYPGDFGYGRIMGNFSLNHVSTNRKFITGISINYGVTKNKLFSANFVNSAITLAPNAPAVYNEDGGLNWEIVDYLGTSRNTWFNPLSDLLNTHEISDGNLVISSSMAYEFVPGLKLKTSMGFTDHNGRELVKFPLASSPPNQINPNSTAQSVFGRNRRNSCIVEPQINYLKDYSNHRIDMILGATWQISQTEYQSIRGSGYVSDVLLNTLQGATSTTMLADVNSEYKYTALYARVGYDFKGRYLLNLTGRRDGSSRFGTNRQFGNFGAIGLAWIFSNESFLKDKIHFLSFGKLRSSYGTTGSDQIGDYKFYNTYRISNSLYQGGVTLFPSGLFNPDYSWEATKKFEAALELGLVNNKVSLEAAWYRNRSSNQLINYQLPATTGFDGVFNNFDATVENSGWEFVMNIQGIKNTRVTWTISPNISANRNKLIAFPDIENSTYAKQYKVGEPLQVRLLYTHSGVNPETGTHEIVDINADGTISADDRQLKSPTNRQYYGGISNVIKYKSFNLSFLVQFTKQKVFGYQYSYPGYSLNNLPMQILNRWQNEGDITNIPKPTNDPSIILPYFNNVLSSDFFVTDASFIRLKTLSLSYILQSFLLEKIRIQEARIFIQGQNLLTIKGDYIGFDPETGVSMPPMKMFTCGFQIKL